MTKPISRVINDGYSPHAVLFGSPHTARTVRCCLVVAHPNDEIVGAGCLVSKLSEVQILHVSDGAPRSDTEARTAGFETVAEFVAARKRECRSALALAGVEEEAIVELGIPQMEVSLRLVELSRRILQFFQSASPQIVLTHAYEGGHPDHDATAFATHAAARLLRTSGLKPPVIFEMAIYPAERGKLKLTEFLLNVARESTTLVLDQVAQQLKQRMFDCFKSQQKIFKYSPLGPEKFRQAPTYDFRLPPHLGGLYYESLGWGMTGKQWRLAAREALRRLFPPTIGRSITQQTSSRYLVMK